MLRAYVGTPIGPPEAKAFLQQSLQIKPDWTIHTGNVLERVLPRSLVAHGLMTGTNRGEMYNERLQRVQGVAGFQKHADGYRVFHALPSLHLVLAVSICCTCQAKLHSLQWQTDAEHNVTTTPTRLPC